MSPGGSEYSVQPVAGDCEAPDNVGYTAEGNRQGYRFASGGSSVEGDLAGQQVGEPAEDSLVLEEAEDEGRESPDIESEDYGSDWDASMSDVSDV